jgi:hypothetical protein
MEGAEEGADVTNAEGAQVMEYDFETSLVGRVPNGWSVAKTGGSEGSDWKIAEDDTAPSGKKVLAQIAKSPSSTFNLCVADNTSFKDVEVSVTFKAVRGKEDQGGGIVCLLNDKTQLEAKDATFDKAGKVGLWTKADAQTYFDDFHAKKLTN